MEGDAQAFVACSKQTNIVHWARFVIRWRIHVVRVGSFVQEKWILAR